MNRTILKLSALLIFIFFLPTFAQDFDESKCDSLKKEYIEKINEWKDCWISLRSTDVTPQDRNIYEKKYKFLERYTDSLKIEYKKCNKSKTLSRNDSIALIIGVDTIYDEAPALINNTWAELEEFITSNYPEEAKKNNVKGKVILELTLSEEGIPIDIRITLEKPKNYNFGEIALRAANLLRFERFEIGKKRDKLSFRINFDPPK